MAEPAGPDGVRRLRAAPLPTVSQAGGARWSGVHPLDGDAAPGMAPSVVDLNVTGRCQLRCKFCWGPEHTVSSPHSVERWIELIQRLAQDGTCRLVFTGGEPLLMPALPAMLQASREAGLVVTLSTNGVLLQQRAAVLADVDHVGIPIDGSTAEMAERMRPRLTRHDGWKNAVAAMRLVRSAGVDLIIRTVVARHNLDDVVRIPAALEEFGVDLCGEGVLYKLYQVMPTGPIARQIPPATWAQEWAVSEAAVDNVSDTIRAIYPALTVTAQCYRRAVGRYFIVDPIGKAYGNDLDAVTGEPIDVEYGNVFFRYEQCITRYRRL
jgi:MoaA/NifB/PqqE/SkfB family radical SAM enzyme